MGVVPGGTRDAQGTQGTAQGTAGLGFPGRVSWARQGGVPSRDGGVMGWKAPGKARGASGQGHEWGRPGEGAPGQSGGLGEEAPLPAGRPSPPRRGGPGSAAGAARPRPNRGPVQHGVAGPCRAGAAAARRGTLQRGRCAPPRPAARLLSLRCSSGWRRREAEPCRAVPGPGWAGMDGPGGGQLPAAAPSRAKLPLGIVFSTALFCGESAAAAVLCFSYSHSDDHFWLALTVFFVLCPSVLVQLTLTFVHRDLSRDRPLVLLMHLLQLGPIIR